MLGLAFAPDYATSHQFVVDYTDKSGDVAITIAKLTMKTMRAMRRIWRDGRQL